MGHMAWEWAAPTATAIVGIGGIIGTYRGGSRQTETVLAVADRQIEAQVRTARDARNQERLERTYQELARFAYRRRLEAHAIRPFFSNQPVPVSPTPEEIERVYIQVATMASPEVNDILDEFGAVLDRIVQTDTMITELDNERRQTGRQPEPDPSVGTKTELQMRLHDDHGKVKEVEKKLQLQMNSELRA
jgi:hypothetical protein